MNASSYSSSTIPGIAEANEPNQKENNKLTHQNEDTERRKSSSVLHEDDETDIEANIKNLTFSGLPNSILRKNRNPSRSSIVSPRHVSKTPTFESQHSQFFYDYMEQQEQHRRSSVPHAPVRSHTLDSTIDQAHNHPNNSKETKQRRKSLLSPSDQPPFNGWRKEFGNAFKKISVISKLKTMRHSKIAAEQHTQSTEGQNNREPFNEDTYTQRLASDLIDSLLSASPASLFASTQFLRDEHGNRRAPLLLAMLDVRVKPLTNISDFLSGEHEHSNSHVNYDSNGEIGSRRNSMFSYSTIGNSGTNNPELRTTSHKKPHHIIFELQFEYGIGENRFKWSIMKSYKEIERLHHDLRLISFQQNTLSKLYQEQNRFSVFKTPYFPTFHDAHKKRFQNSRNTEKNSKTFLSSRSSMSSLNSNSSNSSSSTPSITFQLNEIKMKHLQDLIEEEDDYTQPMHIRLERYFRLLNLALCLRPQANRLFQFYEFSPIGNLLSYETGYQGKEGLLIIRSTAKAQGWRVSHFNAHDFKEMIERHTPKWFLVRDSYIIYVSDICSTTPLDVFMVDSKFNIKSSGQNKKRRNSKKNTEYFEDDIDWDLENSKKISTKLLVTLQNSERKLQIICKSEFSMKQWVASFTMMAKNSIWSQSHRFSSFAPVRTNAFCKYLVDGRDYFWALSDAILMAEDVIYIHDWWLSPEVYLRRPVNGNQEFRLDRLLKKKAEEGVKIFIVVYRNVGNIVGTDSLWTKHSMLKLHDNIHLIRSPNQWLQNTYFWAHHEKLCVIDSTVAFMGGIDLCFGRYDTPEHVLRDAYDDLKDQTFPGKDYSNARVCDFYELNKPFESMYDRNEVPRMPWHDVHMMTIGEAARDMARHFVQRWNYLLREKRPSRPTPLLLPPNDFTPGELENSPIFRNLKERSTCEVQVLRSAGNWSLGLKETEHSIQNAYLKLIETSQHYIYIENQFFVTTSEWDGVIIENKIGAAIVDRIVRANSEGKDWKAYIIIPLMPGFDSPIDQPEASSVRVIMQCQYQSISRGETSIFSKLKKLNIEPMQYIQFFSLRKWSTIGPHDKIVTEQLYVHAKLMIVDDRSCIIGSANINERSQLGSRDSEIAMIVRDTDLIKTKMNDEEYYAGRFAWELRQRLMREHLGCDVDLVEIVERTFGKLEKIASLNYNTLNTIAAKSADSASKKQRISSAMIEMGFREVFDCKYSPIWFEKFAHDQSVIFHNFGIFSNETRPGDNDFIQQPIESTGDFTTARKSKLTCIDENNNTDPEYLNKIHSFNHRAGVDNIGMRDKKSISSDPRLAGNKKHDQEVAGNGPDGWKNVTIEFKESVTEQLREWSLKAMSSKTIGGNSKTNSKKTNILPKKEDVYGYMVDETVSDDKKWDMLKRICYLQHLAFKIEQKEYVNPKMNQKMSGNNITEDTEEIHEKNKNILEEEELDDEALDSLLRQLTPVLTTPERTSKLINLKFIDPYSFADPLSVKFYEELWFTVALKNTLLYRLVFHCQPDNAVQTWKDYKEFLRMYDEFNKNQESLIDIELKHSNNNNNNSNKDDSEVQIPEDVVITDGTKVDEVPVLDTDNVTSTGVTKTLGQREKRRKAITLQMKLNGSLLYGFNERIFDKYTARRILERIHGHLVIFPTEWLAKEVESRNWFYNADRLPPIDIYD
ncbi:hypothetical protein KAFR_0A03420 [Kazachstania africana CBS 2517]|uniref:Phospholipase n=1 Tax=Kazachstania africana (strain ATCC 22294 / BCRC 22015 / CBS 2517 / CECT 1963 / NBRC 1671 / NRRL Y-8276) TaxID=1071382 RepID=H2AN27_KAZAF|nr:hypothetical protein KAFR_0A03420 [Kazachstania africana CBS 2517]CCF55777.1 hypothetical protein KAFR_0A03420 [Kazachstania africana CBS 2517]